MIDDSNLFQHTLVNNAWQFECQHGSNECRGNKYQACVLNQNYTQTINVELINCIMNQTDPSTETTAYNVGKRRKKTLNFMKTIFFLVCNRFEFEF